MPLSRNLTLWGRASSANVQKTLWALEELGLPYEHRLVGGSYGGLDDPAYRALNPNGLVPTVQDGDLTVWESHATCAIWQQLMGTKPFGATIPASGPSSISGPTGPPPLSSPPG